MAFVTKFNRRSSTNYFYCIIAIYDIIYLYFCVNCIQIVFSRHLQLFLEFNNIANLYKIIDSKSTLFFSFLFLTSSRFSFQFFFVFFFNFFSIFAQLLFDLRLTFVVFFFRFFSSRLLVFFFRQDFWPQILLFSFFASINTRCLFLDRSLIVYNLIYVHVIEFFVQLTFNQYSKKISFMSISRPERIYREYILDIYLSSKTSKRPQSIFYIVVLFFENLQRKII